MTDKEKAKKYDEALAKGKAYIEDTKKRWSEEFCKATEKVFEETFPQLAESEDERIRKALIDALKASKSVGELKFVLPEPTRKDCIAYLEKQKEQKPAVTHGETYHVDTLGTQQVIAGKMPQKPAECNKATINGEPISTENQSVDIPLAEWSDKDEASYKAFMCEVVNEKMNPTIEQVNWLRGIRDKLKSFHSIKQEWSEEDKSMLNRIIETLSLPPIYDTKACAKMVSWLKSLRPSWKPSEEQMEALEYVIRDYREDSCNATANYLQEILDHLKNM